MSEAAGLYVHIPFCSAICPYCDFAVTVAGREKRRGYVDALLAETGLAAGFPHAFDTIYLGGGTPSILEGAELERLLAALRATFRFAAAPRLYLEANPEDVDAARLALWRELGVATLSLGVQSFDAGELAVLGRRHDPATARASVEGALAAGFDTVSVDLIYGLPGQAPAALRRRLAAAVELVPHHLSLYELEIHERTTFGKRHARGELLPPDADQRAELFHTTHRVLAEAGYTAYEVSNFARSEEHRSRHNRKYWRHVPYLGLGLGAHSFDGERRSWNERSLPRWEARLERGERPVAGSEMLTPRDRALETLMLGLRTIDGVDLERFARRFGVDLAAVNREHLERCRADGLLRLDGGVLRPTLEGLAVADALAAAFDLDAVPARGYNPLRNLPRPGNPDRGEKSMSSLYDRLGGEAAIDAAVDKFYDKVLADTRITHFFEGIDTARLRAHQKSFLTFAFGGPAAYTGRQMRAAHQRLVDDLGLADEHFDAVMENLGGALVELGVAEDLVQEAAGVAESVRRDVLGQ